MDRTRSVGLGPTGVKPLGGVDMLVLTQGARTNLEAYFAENVVGAAPQLLYSNFIRKPYGTKLKFHKLKFHKKKFVFLANNVWVYLSVPLGGPKGT